MTDLEHALTDAIAKTKAAHSALNRASFEFDQRVRSLVAQPLTSRQMREIYTYAQHDGELWLCGDVLELALRRLRAMRKEARRDAERARAGAGAGRQVAPPPLGTGASPLGTGASPLGTGASPLGTGASPLGTEEAR